MPPRDLPSTQLSLDATSARGPPANWIERGIGLTGAILAAFALSIVGTRLMLLMRRDSWTLPQYLWPTATAFFGATIWIMVLRLTYVRRAEPLIRRGVATVIGAATGAAAWGCAEYLGLTLVTETLMQGVSLERWPECYSGGRPTIVAFMGYFALVFAVLDWWGITSPTRRHRWSLRDPFIAFFWAYLVHMIFPFPQLWGSLVVAEIVAVLPLVSPVFSKAERIQLRMRDDH
ncbi:MAG: hypothetical protein QM775_19515 [Pirellulales bacterium]